VPATRLLKVTEENLALQKRLQQANPTNAHGGSTIAKAHNKSTAAGSNKDSTSTRGGGRKENQPRGTKRGRDEVCTFPSKMQASMLKFSPG